MIRSWRDLGCAGKIEDIADNHLEYLEVTPDITNIQEIKGEKRLLES